MFVFNKAFKSVAIVASLCSLSAFLAITACGAVVDSWSVPHVRHINDRSQRYYSVFYDPNSPSKDPGSALTGFASVHDGDTFTLLDAEDNGLKKVAELLTTELKGDFVIGSSVRLFGVDAPETSYLAGNGFALTTGLERVWAQRATEFVKSQLGYGASVNKALVTINGKEAYSRNVANIKYVPLMTVAAFDPLAADKQTDWNDLAADMIANGLARVAYTEYEYVRPTAQMPGVNALNRAYIDHLIQLQEQAIASRTGLWSEEQSRWWGKKGQPSGHNPYGAIFPKAFGINRTNGLL